MKPKLKDDDETWLILSMFLMMNKRYDVNYKIFPPTIKKIIVENGLLDKYK